MDEISLKALAKINLGLDVLGKREDGYHEVSSKLHSMLQNMGSERKARCPYIFMSSS